MKKRIMGIALAATMVMAGMTGCGGKKTDADNIGEVIDSMSDEELESAILDKADELDSEDDEETNNTANDVKYEPTDEIMNAGFSSGLIQINNEVFQQGGYITVEELYEQYSDKYDFAYGDGTYEENKDYLVEYKDDFEKDHMNKMILTPKYGNTQNRIVVYVSNMTNPDNKIPVSDAQVFSCDAYTDDISCVDVDTPLWTPGGFSSRTNEISAFWHQPDDQESFNEDLSVNDLIQLLESRGYENTTDADDNVIKYIMFYDDYESAAGKFANLSDSNQIDLYVKGNPNLANKTPIYRVSFYIDPNTDKISYMKYDIYIAGDSES